MEIKHNSSNIFQNAAIEYLDILNNISKAEPKKKLFGGRYLEIDKELYDNFKIDMSTIENYLTKFENNDITNWLSYVIKFIEFVKTAIKCFMYNQDVVFEMCTVDYIDDNKFKLTLFDNPVMSLLFEKTSIEIPEEGNIIFDFLNGESDSNVIFVTLTIERPNSKNTDIKFIYGSEIPVSDDIDALMISNAIKSISDCILNTFDFILTYYVKRYSNINNMLENKYYGYAGRVYDSGTFCPSGVLSNDKYRIPIS